MEIGGARVGKRRWSVGGWVNEGVRVGEREGMRNYFSMGRGREEKARWMEFFGCQFQ